MKRKWKWAGVSLCIFASALIVSLLCLFVFMKTETITRSYPSRYMPFAPPLLPPLEPGEIDIFGEDPAQWKPASISEDDFRELFDDDEVFSLLGSATVDDLLERFREPAEYYYRDFKYAHQHLPDWFCMGYSGGVVFHIVYGEIMQIDITKAGYFYKGNIQVGSTLDDVYSVFGPPKEISDMSKAKWVRRDEFYLEQSPATGNMITSRNFKQYCLAQQNVCLTFNNDIVVKMSFFRSGQREWSFQGRTVTFADTSKSFRYRWSQGKECKRRLERLGFVLKMYAEESHGNIFPPLSSEPGCFMFEADELFLKFLKDGDVFHCPNIEIEKADALSDDYAPAPDSSYWYLGYSMINDREAIAFLAAYNDQLEKQLPLKEELPIPYRALSGTTGGNLRQLREGVERFYIYDIGNPGDGSGIQACIPILIERPANHGGDGGHVLFMDGHVEWLPYPGPFPMTAAFIEGLIAVEEKWEMKGAES